MKFALQSIFTLIILLIGVWLFMLIPTPSTLLQGTSVLAIFFYPLAIAFYVSMVGVLGVSAWNLITFIFKEKDEKDYDTPHSENNKKYSYQPNFKQQIQNLNTAVKDTNDSEIETVKIPIQKSSLLFTTFKIGSLIVGISFALAFALLAYFTFILKSDTHKSEIKTYFTLYETEDYNDRRIKYYISELDKNSQKLIQSDNMYNDVVANMKREISLECIKVFRKEHNATKKHQADMQIKNFMLNARNRSAITDNMREISIKKENDLRYKHSASSYSLRSPSLKLQEKCQKMMSVDSIFKKAMPLYIQYQEKNLEKARSYALIYSTNSKYLTSQEKWVKTLHEKYPKY